MPTYLSLITWQLTRTNYPTAQLVYGQPLILLQYPVECSCAIASVAFGYSVRLKVDQSVNMPFRKIPRWRRQREELGGSICHWKHRCLVLNLRPIFQSICVGGNWPRLAYFNWHAYSGYSQLNLLHSSALDKGFVWTLYSGETGVQILRKCHRGENITHLLFLTWNFKP